MSIHLQELKKFLTSLIGDNSEEDPLSPVAWPLSSEASPVGPSSAEDSGIIEDVPG